MEILPPRLTGQAAPGAEPCPPVQQRPAAAASRGACRPTARACEFRRNSKPSEEHSSTASARHANARVDSRQLGNGHSWTETSILCAIEAKITIHTHTHTYIYHFFVTYMVSLHEFVLFIWEVSAHRWTAEPCSSAPARPLLDVVGRGRRSGRAHRGCSRKETFSLPSASQPRSPFGGLDPER